MNSAATRCELQIQAASSPRLLGDLPLLEDPDGVAEWVAEAHVRAVETFRGLLHEVSDAARLEFLVQTLDVISQKNQAAESTLGDQLAKLFGGGFVVHRWTW